MLKLTGYDIHEESYSGSRTQVYRGIRKKDYKPVAIKFLRREYPNFYDLMQFRNQYTIAKNLNIAGIIKTYSLENYQNGYALVMEDFGGISLHQEMTKWKDGGMGRSSEGLREFFTIAMQIVTALEGLYQHGVIHKDIKPANILINPYTKEVKLIDFSIASLLPRETQNLTSPNVLEGTLAYLSPEQTGRINRGVDYRTDFYSLGVTFFELLTGQLPFNSSDPMELLHHHVAKHPPTVQSLNKNIPVVLSEIVVKLMAKNAEDRYQTAYGLRYDLEKCLSIWQAAGKIETFNLGQRDICDRLIIPEKLYGRQGEVETLLTAFDRVCEGAREMMLVAGFSGIGKTAVVNEVHKPIVRARGYFIKGKFDQFQRNIPFSAFVQAFRDLMGQILTESDAQLQQWKSNILSALGENAQVIIDVIPELERIIGKQQPVLELSGNAAQNRFNLLFQRFIQIFTTKEHPLVIFLDDLQWGDSASLKLMQLLMSATETSYLLLIGAYRDNEVSTAHPLILTLDAIRKANSIVNSIILNPLQSSDLNQMIVDTLNCPPLVALPFTKLVYQKTQGNPFFTNQFLKSLYEEDLISFNIHSGYWQCDIAQLKAKTLNDDVVEFMALQLQKLAKSTQDVLKLAACIGNYFDLATLAIVSQKSLAETALDLWSALQAGLIIPTTEVYKFFQDESVVMQQIASANNYEQLTVSYRFLHDRVQQAAYSLIPELQKKLTHLQIGKLLLDKTPKAVREERIFQIVNHLTLGLDLITDQTERYEFAQLNLTAGQKAKAATAYSAAVDYLTVGINMLAADSWQHQYNLTLKLYEEAAEAEFLNGNFEFTEILSEIVLQQAKTLLDQVKIYEVKIQATIAQNQLKPALNIGQQFLKLLSVELPEQPSQADIMQALQETHLLVVDKKVEDLINLPAMTDPSKLAAVKIMLSTATAAYVAVPELYILIVLQLVNLSVKYGNAHESTYIYAAYGLILCGLVGDIEAGFEFGQLALNLLDKFYAKAFKAKILLVVNGFIKHWKKHTEETLEPLWDGYSSALEMGDLEYAAICVFVKFSYAYSIGKDLVQLEEQIPTYGAIISQLNQKTPLSWHYIYSQAILNFRGYANDPCRLIGDAYNEEIMLPQYQAASDSTTIFCVYFNKLILSYLFGDYSQAAKNAAIAQQYLDGVVGLISSVIFCFYDSLTQLALYPDVAHGEQESIMARVAANQEKLRKWGHHAPMNYLHKYDLVEAERYRVLGQNLQAMDYYESAIAIARENQYLNEEALTNELTAKFYLQWGKEKIASVYMTDAYYAYARWGAKAKIDDLEKRYPELLSHIFKRERIRFNYSENQPATFVGKSSLADNTIQNIVSSSTDISEALDLATVMKAAHALASEIELDNLLSTLMQVIMENAGADKCALILLKDEKLFLEATRMAGRTKTDTITTIRRSLPVESSQDIPITIIKYVYRTLESLVIDDAHLTNLLSYDPYIYQQQPKSLLCIPIINQGKTLGILYLENNLTIGAFKSEHIEVLKLLTSQAAISWEKAQLYAELSEKSAKLKSANQQLEEYSHNLEIKVEERTQELKNSELREREKATQLESTLQKLYLTQSQLIQAEKMSSLGQLVAGIAHEINNPVNFIYGNLFPASEYFQSLIDLINLYQKNYPQPTADIQQKIAKIELDFITKDLQLILESMKVGSERIQQIVLSLRNFSRLDEATIKPVDIHSGIDSTLLILQHRFKANGKYPEIQLVKNYGSLPLVNCYASNLNQVFMNLLSNAVDALEEAATNKEFLDNQQPQIMITTEVNSSHKVIIRIADNGPGMSEAVLKKIFDPFFTTKPVGSGTGLGLSISYSIIVEQHRGHLTCNSAPGKGAEFVIEIPM
ncbi:AAA family ATPase [Tolypothrix sp. PCC 7910]|uniref:ATP-binding sensor histidine kinase n=1 Tax=Tolypothrix sp. PCC 7910 TaxID=2099387 RepID=UPI00142775AC|nr:ATP-binding sensor histidine kinase [Tolypothrix sp. PCC 7910]QIR40270.1 AAA family ATPase [Tolypothrix sp. PCC 7910]